MMSAQRIAVVGDAMLDILRAGRITRVSPEDPNCPVVEQEWQRYELGGAANVARWLSNVPGFRVTLFATTADDRAGMIFQDLCRNAKIETKQYLHRSMEWNETTVKERILNLNIEGHPRHLVRVDRDAISSITEDEMVYLAEDLITGHFDAIVVADYQKGIFRGPHGEELRVHIGREDPTDTEVAIPSPEPLTIVNSKRPQDWVGNYVDFLLCNRGERMAAWPENTLSEIANLVRADHVVMTCGEDGVQLDSHWLPALNHIWLRSLATNVIDVTGAGDAFTAGLAYKALQKKHGPNFLGYSGQEIQEILVTGLEWAAHSCLSVGCGEPICPTSLS